MSLILSLLILWTGESWRSMTRSEIVSRAQGMINVAWTPANNQRSWYGDVIYYAGSTYYGVLYSQNNPQENAAEFRNIQSAPTYYGYWSNSRWYNYYGNDCSGYVSICWAMPSRYTTYTFDQQALYSGTYCYYIGATGSAATADLRQGDALNNPSSHIILFNRRVTNGIEAMEQTPNKATYRTWYYSSLGSYRPLRRASIIEQSTPKVTITSYPTQVTAGQNFSVTIQTQSCPTPYDVFVEVKDYSTGQIVSSKKLSSVSSNGTYTVSGLNCPIRTSNYYVYIQVTVTPPGGNWANRYADANTYNNRTLVVIPNPEASVTSYPTSVYANSAFSITVKVANCPTPFDMFVEIKEYSSGSTIYTRKYSSVTSNGSYTVTNLTCPSRTSNYYVYFMVTVTPPGGNWSNRYTYGHTYNNPTLVRISKVSAEEEFKPFTDYEELDGSVLLSISEFDNHIKEENVEISFRNGVLFLSNVSSPVSVEVYDPSGRLVMSKGNVLRETFIGNLPRGIYFVIIKGENIRKSEKIAIY